jgi:hypothetical protein
MKPHTITVEDIYKRKFEDIILPEGYKNYEFIDFRPPKMGEPWLMLDSFRVSTCIFGAYGPTSPRLILGKKKIKTITFRSTGVIRCPREDEWIMGDHGGFYKSLYNYERTEHEIYTRTESYE